MEDGGFSHGVQAMRITLEEDEIRAAIVEWLEVKHGLKIGGMWQETNPDGEYTGNWIVTVAKIEAPTPTTK